MAYNGLRPGRVIYRRIRPVFLNADPFWTYNPLYETNPACRGTGRKKETKMKKEYQARYQITGEPIGMPTKTPTEALKYARKMGFLMNRVIIETWTNDGTGWVKETNNK